MNRDQMMDWIDNAGARELKNPPEKVKEYLSRDRDCMNYYRVSLELTRPAVVGEDLWNRFQLAQREKEKRNVVGVPQLRWLWGISGAAAMGIFVLFLALHPFSIRDQTHSIAIESNNDGALESVVQVASNFNENRQNEWSALDYYYQVSMFK